MPTCAVGTVMLLRLCRPSGWVTSETHMWVVQVCGVWGVNSSKEGLGLRMWLGTPHNGVLLLLTRHKACMALSHAVCSKGPLAIVAAATATAYLRRMWLMGPAAAEVLADVECCCGCGGLLRDLPLQHTARLDSTTTACVQSA